ncbi:hypothetical protein ACLOJK_011644 [Asimina triloba]
MLTLKGQGEGDLYGELTDIILDTVQVLARVAESQHICQQANKPFIAFALLFSQIATEKLHWLRGCTRGDQGTSCWKNQVENGAQMFGSDDEINPTKVPSQVQSIVEGSGTVVVSEPKPIPDLDYLQELLAIQQQGPRAIGFFGTRNMGFMHQQLIEVLSYAMKNHIYTSGASGTNAAVIRGALRAEKPELLTVILPQSLKMQPPESQELLSKVQNVVEMPHNDQLPLIEASRISIVSFSFILNGCPMELRIGTPHTELTLLCWFKLPKATLHLSPEGVTVVNTSKFMKEGLMERIPFIVLCTDGLVETNRLCNMDILSHVQQVICFAFHDSKLLMETCEIAKSMRKIVTLGENAEDQLSEDINLLLIH